VFEAHQNNYDDNIQMSKDHLGHWTMLLF